MSIIARTNYSTFQEGNVYYLEDYAGSHTGTERLSTTADGRAVEYTVEVPEYRSDDSAVVIVPGFCGLEQSYAGLRHQIAVSGRAAITMSQPRSSPSVYLKSLRHRSELPLQCSGLAAVMTDAGEIFGFESYDVVAHSAGGKIAADTWNRSQDTGRALPVINNLALIATAGGDGSNLKDLARRAPRFFGLEFSHDLPGITKSLGENRGASLRQFWSYYGNLAEVAAEGLDAGSFDIIPAIENLKEAGIGMAALQPRYDSLFNPESSRKRLERVVDICLEIEGDHNAPIIKPQATNETLQKAWELLSE